MVPLRQKEVVEEEEDVEEEEESEAGDEVVSDKFPVLITRISSFAVIKSCICGIIIYNSLFALGRYIFRPICKI